MKLKIGIPLFAFAIAFHLQAFAQDITGVVSRVVDGNTVEMKGTDQETYRILLHGIDSPEPGQNFAEQSKEMLEHLLLNKHVSIFLHGKDRWGNRLGEIKVEGSPDPRHELVRAGLAWTSEKDPIAELESLKERARTEGKGLWQEADPVPPWTYRRQQTMAGAKSS